MVIQAETLIDEIQVELKPIEEKLLRHPYVQAIEDGRVRLEKLRVFAGEQYAIIGSDLGSVAHLISRFGGSPSREFFLGVLDGERAAWVALQTFARALGMSEEQLQAYEPTPGAHAYTGCMAWLALYGSDAEVAAAYLVNFPAWGQNCGRLSRILKESYALRPSDVAFFDLFATPPGGFRDSAVAVIDAGLKQGVDPRLIRRAARLLQGYELLYWDTLYKDLSADRGPNAG